MRKRKPDFFIVGAPKCGTTAAWQYLRQHPDIYMPARKEVHFFGSDLQINSPRVTQADYEALFTACASERRCGEASVWYLYSRCAAREIRAYAGGAAIIAMLRNPVDMIYALHSQNVWEGLENLTRFEDALAAEKDRRAGHRLPRTRHAGPLQALFYTEVAMFSEQLERYFHVFGRDSVHVVVYDDFKDNTRRAVSEMFKFLGVDSNFEPELSVVNPAKAIRSERLWRFIKFYDGALRSLWRRSVPTRVRTKLYEKVNAYNTVPRPRPPMKAETRRHLEGLFAPEVARLSELLGRDLTHWTRS